MALEDKIDKLTAVMEKLIDGLAARPIVASLVHDVVSEKSAAVLLEPETPKPRGRPRKHLEPVNTAPVVEDPEPPAFDAPDPEAQDDTADEVSTADDPTPPRAVTVEEAKDMIIKVKDLLGRDAAKAIIDKTLGRKDAKMAEITTPEQCLAAVEAAEAALKAFEEDI